MCRMMCALALAAALGFGAAAGAADPQTPVQGAGAARPKADAGATKGAAARAEAQTKAGTVAAKPAGAPEGVLAILKIKTSTGAGRRTVEKEEILNLMASGAEEAVKIKEFAAKEGYAEVTGTLQGDTMRVASIKEVPKPPEPEKKKAGRKRADP